MDIQLIPKKKLPKEEREKWEQKMSDFVKESEKNYEEWHKRMVKEGYSEEDILRMICY